MNSSRHVLDRIRTIGRVAKRAEGAKRSIPRRLADAGLEAYVVPGNWEVDAILELKPRAVLIANGPGTKGLNYRFSRLLADS